MWTRLEEDVLVQALKELLTTGWRSDNGIRVGYLTVLQDKIMMALTRTDLRANSHISSKMHSWKKQYNTSYTIFGGTGVLDRTRRQKRLRRTMMKHGRQPNEPNACTMLYKSWPYYDSWCEVFGKYQADVDEDAPPSVCEAGSSTTTKASKKGKRKKEDASIGSIMVGINKFTDTTDSRLGEIVSKMGHEHDMTRKCEAVFEIVSQIDDLTIDDKLVATNLIIKNTQVLAMFFSIPNNAKVGQVRLMLPEVFDDDLGDGCVDHPNSSSDLPVHETNEEAEIVPDRDYLEYLICMEFKYNLE
ncbi:hypothetical protein BUALT_Bualt03G0143700 [Buddleja alternifolia]|uniref:Myb/SANT-like domain-containing protein n=1 Tax=Buddleja alternifolia TaxID=168488 RepID=A0AAV6XVC6_9LAMI|nr:hypothetical protein BUALT_Bualt03G0143700 [Buddleja alternifolia]